MAIGEAKPPAAEGGALSLDYVFHPRSVSVAGVSPPQPGAPFAGVGLGFLLALKDSGFEPLYAVNPKYDEVEGVRCYASVLDIEGPVDYVISSVPARIVPALVDDCIAKGVKTIHFFTAGFSETGDEEMAGLESRVVAKATDAGLRVLGPNCMGLYVPSSRLSFHSGFPLEAGPVGFISQSGGNAIDMVATSAVRGIRYSRVVSYGNAADIGESELLEYLAEDPETEIIAAYTEGIKDGRRFFRALRKAAAAKPVVVLKGGRTASGTRAVFSHTASLAGSIEVFDALCRQVNAVRVDSVEEMADAVVAFRFLGEPAGPRVAVAGGGGGFSVFAADEIDEAGLQCPVLPEETQAALRQFTPAAGTSLRNPVDTITLFEPGGLEKTLREVGQAQNIDVVLFHTSFSWGASRRLMSAFGGTDPAPFMEQMVQQMVRARAAAGVPIAVVMRTPLDVEGMERSVLFQEKCWRAGFPVFPTIPRAAAAIARVLQRKVGSERP
ncbi:MAG: CoA-binding protein [Dehalococcoidia bacterium]|nr:CoA-binding protein [Dehalococcoidia bacterium]